MSEHHVLTLTQAAAAIQAGDVSSERLTLDCLARIERFEPELHAFAQVLAEPARAAACRLDEERGRGLLRGPLHGVPIAVKDLIDLAGSVTAAGTTVLAGNMASTSATVAQKLVTAGAVIVGKTQLTEGAYGRHHPQIPAPVNPWQQDYWSGVSSSGSGVAVSAGLVYGALGSDTGGSIRFPSAACGLVGLKPTYGRVSRAGVFPLAETLDHIGPMTRCVSDAAALFEVIAGVDARDPTSLSEPVTALEPGTDLRGIRIGLDRSYAETGVDTEVVAALAEAVDAIRGLGADIVEVRVPDAARLLADSWWLSCGVEVARAHASTYPSQKEQYGPALASLIEQGLHASQTDYEYLQSIRGAFRRDFEHLYRQCDLIVMPTMNSPTQTAAAMEKSEPNADLVNGLTFTAPFDYSGHPTLTLPMTPDGRGMPRSFQLVAPLLGEGQLLAAGAALESVLAPPGVAPAYH